MDFTEDTATDAVLESLAGTPDTRLRELLTGLVRHLHAFVRESEPTLPEWMGAVEFLTDTGQACDATRQELILLSDVLGVSMLVETINARTSAGVTESTVLGPFHVVASPHRELGDTIYADRGGEQCLVHGRVRAVAGGALGGASVDVWQADEHGFYDVQRPGLAPPGSGRGLFRTDASGRFWFRTVVPSPYPIPTDGPVGRLLGATGRHPFRPAHIHFLVEAPGHLPVTTHMFVADSPYLDSDAVFAVRRALVRAFSVVDDASRAAEHGLPSPFREAAFDVVLEPVPA